MSASSPTIGLPRSAPGGRVKVTQVRVTLSEWTKLRSLRSTLYTLAATAVFTIGFGAIASAVTASRWGSMSPAEKANFDPLTTSLMGVNFGLLAIGVLGVMLITGEYSTGMIRSTFAAVPKRLPVLWAKAVTYSLVALAVAVPSTLIAFFAGQGLLTSRHIEIAFSHAGVARAVLGSALYMTLVGLFGLGLGAILRNTAAAIAGFAAIMFVIPPLIGILPASVANEISPYLPSRAGGAIMDLTQGAHTLAPWAGLGLFAAYTAAVLAGAAVLLVTRDA